MTMPPDIAIGHCAIRLRRRGADGARWQDPGDHRRLAARVQTLIAAMLEDLLAQRLAEASGPLPAALHLDLRLRAQDLAGAAPLARPALRAHLGAAITAALSEAAAPGEDPASESAAPFVRPLAEASVKPARDAISGARRLWTRYLARLAASGALAPALTFLPDETLITLIEALVTPPSDHGADPRRKTVQRTPADPEQAAPTVPDNAALRALILALVPPAADGRHGPDDGSATRTTDPQPARIQTPSPAALGAARAAIRVFRAAETARRQAPDAGPDAARPPIADADAGRRSTAFSPRTVRGAPPAPPILAPGRYPLASLLPFLMLGPLSRHGVLDALALGSRTALPGLAAALALCALSGFRQAGSHVDAMPEVAGLFAAAARPVPGSAIQQAARDSADTRALTGASIAAALIPNLMPRRPLPVLQDGRRVTVFDPCGLYPILDGPLDALAMLRDADPVLMLARPSAPLWQAVDAAGLAAIAPGPPLRGEPYSPLIGPRGWTGHSNAPPVRIAALRGALSRAEDDARTAGAVWTALTAGPPPVAAPAVDDMVDALARWSALTTGFALADIGWALAQRDPGAWGDPDPLLVRDRFADFSGTLDVTEDTATVILPLGRRFADLRDAGLLDSVRDVPWWPGRAIAFRGG
jgi:hypothetical protein